MSSLSQGSPFSRPPSAQPETPSVQRTTGCPLTPSCSRLAFLIPKRQRTLPLSSNVEQSSPTKRSKQVIDTCLATPNSSPRISILGQQSPLSSSPTLAQSIHGTYKLSPLNASQRPKPKPSQQPTMFPNNYLSAQLDVQFENDGIIDMIGGPNTGWMPLTAPGRYTPMRVFASTLNLVPSEALLVPSSDPSRPHASKLQMALPFDLRLPGWLPNTHSLEMTNVSYGCIVQAIVGWTGPVSASTSTLTSTSVIADGSSNLMRDLISKQPKPSSMVEKLYANCSLWPATSDRSTSKWQPFIVRRHRIPPAVGQLAPEQTERHFTLRPEANSTSPIECVVSVPEFIDVNGEERSLKVSLRIRARKDAIRQEAQSVLGAAQSGSVEDGACERSEPVTSTRQLESVPMERSGKGKKEEDILTRMVELGMEVEETEWFSSTPSSSFMSSFPVPEAQPSRHSNELLNPSSAHAQSTLGYNDRPFKGTRTRSCLLSEDGNQRNFFFADEGLGLGDKWRKVNVVLPMPAELAGKGMHSRPRPEFNGPFARIKHSLKIRVVCHSLGSSDDAQVVLLSTPIRFGTCPTTIPSERARPESLPAYIQLFLENGDLRECDPLPLYSECVEPASTLVHAPAVPATPAPDYSSLLSASCAATNTISSRSSSPFSSSSSASAGSSSTDLPSLDPMEERSGSPALPSSDDERMDIDETEPMAQLTRTKIIRSARPGAARRVA
ncbi:uncharacterized protein L203_105930 [Cryptococcus depauperatus CBS 7841]|uniref:Uncharacterized protein n=1 Tax=Cryptococcus depauperatus CBS 7841 TaxID=1295531 RepID=A0AAJ8M3Y4_9TREE